VMNQNREKIKRNDKLFLLLAFIIVAIFIIQDYSYEFADEERNSVFEDSLIGVLYSIIAAVINSINSIIDKKICFEFHSYTILFVTGVFTMVLSPIFMAIRQDKFFIGTRNFILFFLFGASSFFAYYFNHKTIEANNLLINSSLQNITIFLSYIYTIFVFDEPFTEYDIFASSLIIFINFYMKQRVEECEDIENL
jgi:drug/metabolite transporter (DMT)-like permease